MPADMKKFELLAYLALGLAVLTWVLDFWRFTMLKDSSEVSIILISTVLIWVAYVVLIWLCARRGKNWARWVFAALVVSGALMALPTLSTMMRVNSMVAMLTIIQLLMQGVAVYFCFTAESKAWFKRQSSPA